MKTKSTSAKITSRNEAWGFFSTIRENLKLTQSQTEQAFDSAARFTAERLQMSPDAARRFLDSRYGRHLADKCADLASINEALGHAYATWKRDTNEFRRAAINTTDEAFYC